MSKSLTIVDETAQLPAHLAQAFGAQRNDDLASGVSSGYPVISYKGKTWAISAAGVRTQLMKQDDPSEPALSISVVLVKANQSLSKVYYDGGYSEGSDDKPTCYSHDGVRPGLDAISPQCTTCALCPHNAWGSRITENSAKGKACADSRRVAVVPVHDLAHPMLLRVPAGSLKELASYAATLTRRNAPYQAVVTKIGFDHTVAHPKLTFTAVRWLTADEAVDVGETLKKEVIGQIVGGGSLKQEYQSEAASSVEALPPPPSHVSAPTAPTAPTAPAAPAAQAAEPPAPKKPRAPKAKAVEPAAAPVAAAPKVAVVDDGLLAEASSELDAVLGEFDD